MCKYFHAAQPSGMEALPHSFPRKFHCAGNVMISGLITLVVGTLQTKLQCGPASKSLNHLFHHLDTGALAVGMGLWIPIINQRDSCLCAWGSPFLPFTILSQSGVLTGVVSVANAEWQLEKKGCPRLILKHITSPITPDIHAHTFHL